MAPRLSARDALRPYAGERWAVRAHVRVRWASCPFGPVVDAVPRTARVLDYGCGHGLLANVLAGRGCDVLGVDVDGAKVEVARRCAVPGARFEILDPGSFPAGPWDAITIVDVLYLLDRPSQRRALEQAVAALAPGGVLVVKEMSDRPPTKAVLLRLQEHLAVRVLRITAGSTICFVAPDAVETWLGAFGLSTFNRRIDRGYPHPHHLVVAHVPR